MTQTAAVCGCETTRLVELGARVERSVSGVKVSVPNEANPELVLRPGPESLQGARRRLMGWLVFCFPLGVVVTNLRVACWLTAPWLVLLTLMLSFGILETRVTADRLVVRMPWWRRRELRFDEIAQFHVPHYRSTVQAILASGEAVVVAKGHMIPSTEIPAIPEVRSVCFGTTRNAREIAAELDRRKLVVEAEGKNQWQ